MKKSLDGINLLYPTPTTIVGAMVEGRPNFIHRPYRYCQSRQTVSDIIKYGQTPLHQCRHQKKQGLQCKYPL